MSRVCRNGVLAEGDATPGSFPVGAAFFETVALRAGTVECLDDHLARLRTGMTRAGIAPGPLASGDMEAWRAAIRLLGGQEGVLRLVVGPDFEELGLRALLPSPEVFRLRSLRTVRDAAEWLPRPKSAPWANSMAAAVELRSLGVGAGVEGVQFDARGFVSEGSRSSLAWVEGGVLHVPAETTDRLPGTALGQLIRCAGLPVRDAAEWLPRPKSAPWANSMAASVELRSLGVGAGVEGVQFDARGFVSEGSRSSLAWVEGGVLHVPAETTDRLPGTALGQLIRCAGLPVREVASPVPVRADAILLLRSTLPGGASAVSHWDDAEGRPLWSGDPADARPLLGALAAWRAQRCISFA